LLQYVTCGGEKPPGALGWGGRGVRGNLPARRRRGTRPQSTHRVEMADFWRTYSIMMKKSAMAEKFLRVVCD
jgi:hypothetical protein